MAKALKKTLQQAQKMGRGRDTILAHITPEEARLLKARGGRGSRNPQTGLLEFEEDEDVLEGEEDYTYKGEAKTNVTANSFVSGDGQTVNAGEGKTVPAQYPTSSPSDSRTDTPSRDNNTPAPAPEPAPAPVPMPDQIRNELKGWGGTTEQIDQILASLGENDLDVLLDELKNVPQEDRIVYLIDNFGDAVTDWGGAGGTQAIPLNDATRASELQKPQEQRLQEAVDRQVLGSSTGEGLEDNGDGSFTDPDTGTTYYRAEDGKLTDRDGNVRYDPGTGLAAEIDYNREQQSLAEQGLYGDEGIVSQIQQTATDYGDFADQTRASLDDPRNDFALQITGEINNFLNGKGGGKGFLDYQADLLGAGDTFKQQMGVLSQQYDDAYAQNQGDINRLRGDYASMTETYAKELNPLRNDLGGVRDRLGQVSQGQMDVAKDASDRAYYNRLRDTLYADATDNIGRQTEAGMDSIRQNFAASGADPTSPAFIAAMKDLQQGRSDAMVSARRKAILDSYGLGSQMLGQRSQALSGAGAALGAEGSAIGAEMGALDSLYGMKSAGLQADANLTGQQMQNRMNMLNTRGDMIGNMYDISRANANTGIQGLNTVLNANTNAINTKANQFYKNIGLNSDLYSGQMDFLGKSANALGTQLNYYDTQRQNAFDTLLEANQGQKSDAYLYGTLQDLYEKNNMEMPDFVNNAFGK